MLTIAEARDARDAGMQAAATHANRKTPSWTDRAFAAVCDFFKAKRPPLLAEVIREAAYAAGLPRPPDERAWGAVMRRLVEQNVIRRAGWDRARSSNMSEKPTWIARARKGRSGNGSASQASRRSATRVEARTRKGGGSAAGFVAV